MDGNHPKRKKDKQNPYTLTVRENGYFLSFKDGQGIQHDIELDEQLYILFNSFELEDISYLNEISRHYEHSELTEQSLYERAFCQTESTEETAIRNMQIAKLHKAIAELPEIQRRRLILYYFGELTYEQIAEMEGCTKRAVKFSVDIAIGKLKEKI